MLLSKWQADEVAAYVRGCCGPKSLVAGDMTDHLCCLVEEAMDDGAEFDEAFETARRTLTEEEIVQTERDTKKIMTMDRKKRWAWVAVAISVPAMYILLSQCSLLLLRIHGTDSENMQMILSRLIPFMTTLAAFAALALTRRRLSLKEQLTALLAGVVIMLSFFALATYNIGYLNWRVVVMFCMRLFTVMFSAYLAWRCRPLWGKIAILACVAAYGWFGQTPLHNRLYKLFYQADLVTGQADRRLDSPLVFTRPDGTTFTTGDFPGKYIIICVVDYNSGSIGATTFKNTISSKFHWDDDFEVILAAYDPSGKWEDAETIKERRKKGGDPNAAPLRSTDHPYVQLRDYRAARKAFHLPVWGKNVFILRDGVIIFEGTPHMAITPIQELGAKSISHSYRAH